MVDSDLTTVFQEHSKHLIKGAQAYFIAREALAKNEDDFSSILLRKTSSNTITPLITANFAAAHAELNKLKTPDNEEDYLTLRETILQLMHIASWSEADIEQLNHRRRKKLEQLLSDFSAACAAPNNVKPITKKISGYTFSEAPIIDEEVISKDDLEELEQQKWFKALEPTLQHHYQQQVKIYLDNSATEPEKQQARFFLFNHSPLLAKIPGHRAFFKTTVTNEDGFYFTEYRSASNVCREISNHKERAKKTEETIKGKIRAIKKNRGDQFSVNGITPNESYKPILLIKSNYVELGDTSGATWSALSNQTDEDIIANEERRAVANVKQNEDACAGYELLRCGHSFFVPTPIGLADKVQTEQRILFNKLFEKAADFFKSATYKNNNQSERFSPSTQLKIKSYLTQIKDRLFNKTIYKKNEFPELPEQVQNHIRELLFTLNEYTRTFGLTNSCPRLYDNQHQTLSGLEAYATHLLGGDVLTECKTGRNRSVVQGNWGKSIGICIHEGTINRRALKYWFGNIFHEAPHRESINTFLPGSGRFRKNLGRLLPEDFIEKKNWFKSKLSALASKLKITDALNWLHAQFYPEKHDSSIAKEKKADYALTEEEVAYHESGSSMARLKEQKKTPNHIMTNVSNSLKQISLTDYIQKQSARKTPGSNIQQKAKVRINTSDASRKNLLATWQIIKKAAVDSHKVTGDHITNTIFDTPHQQQPENRNVPTTVF